MNETALRLPPGHALHSLKPEQTPSPGGIYLAVMPGDLETLFGPAEELEGREFLLEVDGARWFAAPMLGIVATPCGMETIFTTGGVHARTDGQQTSIDFKLLRKASNSRLEPRGTEMTHEQNIQSHAFNALTDEVLPQWMCESDRERVSAAVVTAVEPVIRRYERARFMEAAKDFPESFLAIIAARTADGNEHEEHQ